MKRITLALVASLALLTFPTAQANHAWQNFHWARSSNPVNLSWVDSAVGVWDSIVPSAAGQWTSSPVLNLNRRSGSSGLLTRLLCSPQAGVVHVCNANYGPTGWFGVTTVRTTGGGGGHIASATLQLNDFYFTGSFGNNVARHHVACHELGHAIGLDHIANDSCMNPDNALLNTPANQDPNAHDFEQLAGIYAHLDGGAQAASAHAKSGPDTVQRIGDVLVLTYIFYA